jgi:hypothetical protein
MLCTNNINKDDASPRLRSGPSGQDEDGVFTERGGEPGQGPATAGCPDLVFQPGHGGQAEPRLVGELFLGQAVLAA